MIPFVDLNAQYVSIKNEIDEAIASVIRDSAYVGGKNNPYVRKFEESFAEYIGVKHLVSCANGTDALEILLKAMGVGEGDEVIVPALTWISTAEAVVNVGATPVFVDILADCCTIDPTKIEKKITALTKVIIPVHLFGHPAEMDTICLIAKQHNLKILEDCAQAHGAVYKGRKIGSIGDAAAFSFYPGKNLGAYGDAGGMATNDVDIAETAQMIANHGQKEKHNHIIEGRNSRLDGLNAALLSVKLKYLDEWNAKRCSNAKVYDDLLKDVVEIPTNRGGHVYHLYVIKSNQRDKIAEIMKSQSIETAIHYPTALPLLKVYSKYGYSANDYPIAASVTGKILSLPMYAELSRGDIEEVSRVINEIVK